MEKNSEKMAKMAWEADGNIVGESFIIHPEKNLAGKLGVLFGVIEIYNINDVFLDGLLSAINDLKTEFYLPPFHIEQGIEKRFEQAISRANRRILAAVNQSIEEVDLRNVSAAIGLFHGNKVYLSSAGRAKGLFFRRKKNGEMLIIDILSGNGEARFRPEPEKLFANILSGDLSERDALFLINEEYLAVFSQKELGETVLDNAPTEAIRLFDAALKERVTRKNFYGVIIAPNAEQAAAVSGSQTAPLATQRNASTAISGQARSKVIIAAPQTRSNKPAQTQQSIDRLLYTQVRTEKYLTPSLLPQWQKLLVIAGTAIKKYSILTAAKSAKFAAAAATSAVGQIKTIFKRKGHSAEDEARPISNNVEEAKSENNQIAEEYFESAEAENLPHDELPMGPELPMEEIPVSPAPVAGNPENRINDFLNAQIEKFLALKRGQQIILSLGLILIFLFSQSVVMIGRNSDKSQSGSSGDSTVSRQIDDLLSNAEAQNIFNDEVGAVQSIRKARELLAQVPNRLLNKSFKAELQAKIDAMAKALQKINFNNDPAVAGDFSSDGTPAELVGLARTGKVFWAFDNLSRSLYRLDTATGKITLATTSLSSVTKLSAIDDKNLIIMTAGKTQYKYAIAQREAAKTKPAKDYFAVKLPATASPLIDPPLASSTIEMSIVSETYSFYLDGQAGRVVAVDKNGILKRQFYSDKFKGAGALTASYKEKKLWVFNDGKVYQVDLDF